MAERWEDIEGYEGMYQVSNHGRVRSLDRMVKRRMNGKEFMVNRSGSIMSLSPRPNGYLRIELNKNGKRETFSVHRLVALHFIANSQNKREVNHIDGDKENNHVNNLEWTTRSENELHAYESGIKETIKGEDNGKSKLSETDVIEIRNAYRLGCFTYSELANAYGITKGTVGPIIRRETWKHI